MRETVKGAIMQLQPQHAFLLAVHYGLPGTDWPMHVRVIQRKVLGDRISQRSINDLLVEGRATLGSQTFVETFSAFFD